MSSLVLPESYVDNCSTTVAGGGYTSGSGVLNVASTGTPFSQTRQFHFSILDQTNYALKCIGKATAINSSTQWAVTMSLDANANSGDIVVVSLVQDAMDQIRKDMSQQGAYASLPTVALKGDRYRCTDIDLEFVYDGTVWQPWCDGFNITLPTGSFAWQSQGSATLDTSLGVFTIQRTASEAAFNVHAYVMSTPSTPYHVILGFKARSGTGGNLGAGPCWSDGTKYALHLWPFQGDLYRYVYFYNSNNTTNNATGTNASQFFNMGKLQFVRFGDDGTTRTWDHGPTPTGPWFQIGSEARTTNLTPTKIGIFVNGGITFCSLYHLATTA